MCENVPYILVGDFNAHVGSLQCGKINAPTE